MGVRMVEAKGQKAELSMWMNEEERSQDEFYILYKFQAKNPLAASLPFSLQDKWILHCSFTSI